MTDPIKAKIQELCPDVLTKSGGLKVSFEREWPITLAVVLRAIGKIIPKFVIHVNKGSVFFPKQHIGSNLVWNLEHDNYDQQSQECKQFIGSLLGI